MPRGIDHIVHAVRELDAAADLYRRLGFSVGARNKHPWGTHNYVVQLPGSFIELLTVGEPEKLGNDDLSRLFGRFNQRFLEQREGLSQLVLESKDAQADVEAFAVAGISVSPKLDFEREARRPDGTPIKVAFSLAFAVDRSAPLLGFFTCQQHHPENFWNPAFQQHGNTAAVVRGVVMVADVPPAHRDFLVAFTGVSDLYVIEGEVSAPTPRGTFSVMTPSRFAAVFGGETPAAASGAQLAAIRFGVADIRRADTIFEAAKVPARRHRDGFVLDPGHAMGAWLSFEPLQK